MLHIAICDDTPDQLQAMQDAARRFFADRPAKEYEIAPFSTSLALLDSLDKTGGSITGNQIETNGYDAGPYPTGGVLGRETDFTVGGTAKITGNKIDDAASNVYLYYGVADESDPNITYTAVINCSTVTPLASGAKIGVTSGATTYPAAITTANNADYSEYFVSDDASCKVYNDNNTVG